MLQGMIKPYYWLLNMNKPSNVWCQACFGEETRGVQVPLSMGFGQQQSRLLAIAIELVFDCEHATGSPMVSVNSSAPAINCWISWCWFQPEPPIDLVSLGLVYQSPKRWNGTGNHNFFSRVFTFDFFLRVTTVDLVFLGELMSYFWGNPNQSIFEGCPKTSHVHL